MNNKKNNILLTILVIIVMLIVIFIVGYYVLNIKVKKENNESITTAATSNKVISIESDTVQNLYSYVKNMNYVIKNIPVTNVDESELYSKNKVSADDLSYDFKMTMALSNIAGTDIYSTESYDAKEVISSYKRIFGTEPQLKTFTNVLKAVKVNYDSSTSVFTSENYGFGLGTVATPLLYKAEKENNIIYLYILRYYSDSSENYDASSLHIYSTYSTVNGTSSAVCTYDIEDDIPKDCILKNINRFNKFKVTYQLNNNNYIFKQIEKIK